MHIYNYKHMCIYTNTYMCIITHKPLRHTPIYIHTHTQYTYIPTTHIWIYIRIYLYASLHTLSRQKINIYIYTQYIYIHTTLTWICTYVYTYSHHCTYLYANHQFLYTHTNSIYIYAQHTHEYTFVYIYMHHCTYPSDQSLNPNSKITMSSNIRRRKCAHTPHILPPYCVAAWPNCF